MHFKKYTEIENSCNEKYIKELKEQGFFDSSIEYVIENKVDGSNLQCSIDENEEFRFGSRTQEYPKYADFMNCSSVFLKEQIESKLQKMKHIIYEKFKDKIPEKFVLTVYGELCGGMYRHPDVEKVKGANKIQGRVDYHPDNKWIPFDIAVRDLDGKTLILLDQDDVVKVCSEVGLPYPLILFRGTLDECLKYPVEFIDPTGNYFWNLPVIENNYSEGVVIKPNKALWKRNSERVILKNKGSKFKERISKQKEKKEILPLTELEQKWYNIVEEYITESRLMSVLSKIDTTKLNDKMFGLILGSFLKDMWKDFYKDNEPTLLDEISPDLKFDKVRKEISKSVAEFIRPKFLELLNK